MNLRSWAFWCVGAVVVGVLTVLAVVPSHANRPGDGLEVPDGRMVVQTTTVDRRQWVTVVDISTQSMAVYEVSLETGEIALKSVRRLQWDLQLTDFNTSGPLPSEVRSMFRERG